MPQREAMSLTLPSLFVCLHGSLPKISCLLFTVTVLQLVLNICKFVLSLWSSGCSLSTRDCFVLSQQDWFPPGHQVCPAVSSLVLDHLTVHVPIWLAFRIMGVLEMMGSGCNYFGYRILLFPYLDGWWVAGPCKTEGVLATGKCLLHLILVRLTEVTGTITSFHERSER